MSQLNPIKHSPTRSMNRGDSNVEKFWNTPKDFHGDAAAWHHEQANHRERMAKQATMSHEAAYKRGLYGVAAMHKKEAAQHTQRATEHRIAAKAASAQSKGTKLAASVAGEKFADLPPRGMPQEHHDVLVKHGYKYVGGAGAHHYEHPSGWEAWHSGGKIGTGLHGGATEGPTDHSAKGLDEHLNRKHGHSDAKLSVSAGAAMDPAVKAKHSDEPVAVFAAGSVPKGMDADHHKVLVKHGFRHVGGATVGGRAKHYYERSHTGSYHPAYASHDVKLKRTGFYSHGGGPSREHTDHKTLDAALAKEPKAEKRK